jgi:23S rRNA (pseudouridine1915-N3)-methyltransferase
MNITVICVGKIKEKFYREAVCEYSKRLSKFCKLNIIEVDDEEAGQNLSPVQESNIKDKEGERILKKIPSNSYVFTLAIEGKKYDSVSFSKNLNDLCIKGQSSICFIIGGSLGLSDKIKDLSNAKLSFSDMTFPHQLMRVVLLEQIYRSFKIINNEPYHK